MKELDLQGDYVMNFFCRREDGLGYREVKNTSVNDELFIPSDLEEFIKENSPETWSKLMRKYPNEKALITAIIDKLKEKILEATNVAIFLGKNRNINFDGETIRLFNVSGTELSGDEDFKKNIFSAVEEVPFFYKVNGDTQFSIRPDISFFVNGIFIGYAELKSNFNNQSAKANGRKKVVINYMEAVQAYARLADGNDIKQSLRRKMLRIFEKAIHITSTDIRETYVIRNIAQYFDELKKGFTDGSLSMCRYEPEMMKTFKPYPLRNPEAPLRDQFEEVMRSLYAKEEIQKEILYYNFMQYEYVKKNGKKEYKSKTGRLIAPRPKQKFGCDKILNRIDELLEHEKEPNYFINKLRKELEIMGAAPDFIEKVIADRDSYSNNKNVYSLLMQYAAGFGKSNIIGWTALQLKDLRKNEELVYDKILIVVDRLQLRDQLDDTMRSMNIDGSMFVEATNKKTFIKALTDIRRIIVVNIQKFMDLKEALNEKAASLSKMRVAFLIDEIHRSNTGDGHEEMVSLFDNLQDVFDQDVNYLSQQTKKNLIVGFTATPSERVLVRFGEYYSGSNINQLWKPFDCYSMREAIEDGYILDPTKHIIPVPAKMYYEIPELLLNYVSGDNEEMRYGVCKDEIYSNKDRIEALSGFIVNRLLSLVYSKIRGTGKAMLAVTSIPIAIEYCECIRKQMEKKMATGKYDSYKNAPISIVYSDRQDVPKCKNMNYNTSEETVIKNFQQAKNGLIIVVDKLQTGFDEPKLHTLFLDKEIHDINAIQTISRVNRTCKYKEECHIIDLSHNNVNEKNIKEAFGKYCDIVISDFDPLSQRAILEKEYKQLTEEILFIKWFNKYNESLSGSSCNTTLVLEMEDDFGRWIHQAIQRKAEEDKKSKEDDGDETTQAYNDAKKLKIRIGGYFSLISTLNGILDIDHKFTGEAFIDFWQRYNNIYRQICPNDHDPGMEINVSYDNELGLIASTKNENETPTPTGEGGGTSKTSGKSKHKYNVLDIIAKLNANELEKEKRIKEWEEKIDHLFIFLNEDKKLLAKINTPEAFSREHILSEYKKSLRKYLRSINDPVSKQFFEDNKELLFEDFESSIGSSKPQNILNMYLEQQQEELDKAAETKTTQNIVEETSDKENTLYLTIKQTFFDQIIAGTKKEEYREIKDTTYLKYLAHNKEGMFYDTSISPEDPGDIMIYNNGEYPYIPIDYKYLYLAVGYAKERDTATVEVKHITFEVAKDKQNKEMRFNWNEKEGVIPCADGELAIWQVVYHLGEVIELNRK